MKSALRIILRSLGLLVIVVTAVIILIALNGGVGRPVLYEFPAGYHGWILIRYEVPDCPALQTRGLYLVIAVPDSGRLCTSSTFPYGWRYAKSEYVHPDGRRMRLYDRATIWFIGSNNEKRYERVFVGYSDELTRSWSSEPKDSEVPYPWQMGERK